MTSRDTELHGKPFEMPTDAELGAMVAELPGKFRWQEVHRRRYVFDPSGRAAPAANPSKPLTDDEIEAMINEVWAEGDWENEQRLLAEGVSVAESINSGDPRRAVKKIKHATFGSERWFRRLLIETLLTIRQGCKPDSNGMTEAERDRLRDPEKDVHLCIPRRHRRLHRLAEEWNSSMPWIAKLLDPKDEDTAVFIMAGLKSIGIDAYVVVRLCDLDEERRIG